MYDVILYNTTHSKSTSVFGQTLFMLLSLKTISLRNLLGKMYVVNRIVTTICNGLRQCVLVQYVQMLHLISYIYNRMLYYYHFTFTGARSKGWFSKERWSQSATETCNGVDPELSMRLCEFANGQVIVQDLYSITDWCSKWKSVSERRKGIIGY